MNPISSGKLSQVYWCCSPNPNSAWNFSCVGKIFIFNKYIYTIMQDIYKNTVL